MTTELAQSLVHRGILQFVGLAVSVGHSACSRPARTGAPPNGPTRGQEGPAPGRDYGRWSQCTGSLPGERRPPAPAVYHTAFDQLLFFPQPAVGQSGAELPAAGRPVLFLPFRWQARSLGKRSFFLSVCHLMSSSTDPGGRQSKWVNTLMPAGN